MTRRLKWLNTLTTLLCVIHTSSQAVFAGNPHFYITGPTRIFSDSVNDYTIYMEPEGETITAAQIVLSFDNDVIDGTNFSTVGSTCSFWAPADPSLGLTDASTPYFYNDNQLILACGFSNPGYGQSTPAKIINVTFQPNNNIQTGVATTLALSDPQFRYIGTTITSGTNISLDITSYDASQSAAEPTATPGLPAPDTLTEDDLTFIDIGSSAGAFSGFSGTTGTLTSGDISALENTSILDLDDTIPPPPANLVPREAVTPRPLVDPNGRAGNVLSVQSLKELLIPGQSDADRTVVLINLLSTLAFLIILIILIWRLILSRRVTRVKSEHIKDMLQGEISSIEAKVEGGVMLDSSELNKRLEELKRDLDSL